jgi:two-component system sensor histidine kinase TctE
VARLHGQPVLVREMVRNLVDNALQYTPEGGTVTARVTPDPFGQVLVLQVEDNGPGMPEAERELVFQPFYRRARYQRRRQRAGPGHRQGSGRPARR